MKKLKNYYCDGLRFYSFEDVVEYCERNDYRITNTTTQGGKYFIDVASTV